MITSDDDDQHTNGYSAVDGNTNTVWTGSRDAIGWWLALGYNCALDPDAVVVILAETSSTNLQIYASSDALAWDSLDDVRSQPQSGLNYLWLIFQPDASGQPPSVREITAAPAP